MSTDQKQDLARLPDVGALRRIRMLLLDVDGVLTDGRIHFDPEGREYKSFHTRDAAGLVYWHRSGHLSGFLSGRGGHVVEMRAKQLGIHEPVLNRIDKERAFEEILARQKLDASEIAYVGDDLLDPRPVHGVARGVEPELRHEGEVLPGGELVEEHLVLGHRSRDYTEPQLKKIVSGYTWGM